MLFTMETENENAAAHELFLLGCIAGLCAVKEYDEIALAMLRQELVRAQVAKAEAKQEQRTC